MDSLNVRRLIKTKVNGHGTFLVMGYRMCLDFLARILLRKNR